MILREFLDHAVKTREPVNLYLVTANRITGQVLTHDAAHVVVAKLMGQNPQISVVEMSKITTYELESAVANIDYWAHHARIDQSLVKGGIL